MLCACVLYNMCNCVLCSALVCLVYHVQYLSVLYTCAYSSALVSRVMLCTCVSYNMCYFIYTSASISRVKHCACVSYNMCNCLLCFALVCRITCNMCNGPPCLARQWVLGAALDWPLSSSWDNLCTLEPYEIERWHKQSASSIYTMLLVLSQVAVDIDW